MGFVAARWRRPETMAHLDEWGLGGRSFGSWITWFLVGGDLYTAYTFVAVPALLFGAGATGFLAVPYTVIVYPLVFVPLIRALRAPDGVDQTRSWDYAAEAGTVAAPAGDELPEPAPTT